MLSYDEYIVKQSGGAKQCDQPVCGNSGRQPESSPSRPMDDSVDFASFVCWILDVLTVVHFFVESCRS